MLCGFSTFLIVFLENLIIPKPPPPRTWEITSHPRTHKNIPQDTHILKEAQTIILFYKKQTQNTILKELRISLRQGVDHCMLVQVHAERLDDKDAGFLAQL